MERRARKKGDCKNGNVPGLLTFNLVKDENEAKTSDSLLIEVQARFVRRKMVHFILKVMS